MFEKEYAALEEIKELKEIYRLPSEQVFLLQILKFSEIANVKYIDMKEYFIGLSNYCADKSPDDTNKLQPKLTK